MEKLKEEDFQAGTNTRKSSTKTTDEDLIDFETEWDGKSYKPLFNCPQCKGAGFVHPRKPDGSVDYKGVVPCDYPRCYGEQARDYKAGQMIENSGVIEREQTFENFDAKIPGVKKAYEAAEKMAEGLGKFIWLMLYGGVGNGKTHLLNAIANRTMFRGQTTKLVMMAELLSELRMAMDDHTVDSKLKELKEVRYLLIDELGLEHGTDWEKEKIEELLAARWNNGRFTVVASNLDIEDFPERIKSRFKDVFLSRAILNKAVDYRLTRGKSR